MKLYLLSIQFLFVIFNSAKKQGELNLFSKYFSIIITGAAGEASRHFCLSSSLAS